MMMKSKCGPGVFWLRNIFSLKNGYERKEVKKLTPESLLRALEGQLKKLQALSDGESYSVLEFSALFSLQQGDSFNCTWITECWPSILQTHATVISDPNTKQ
jgi:hypothetical protein